MLASNQPYKRVDDGIGAGFIGGALAGGAAAGAAHLWGDRGIKGLQSLSGKAGMAGARTAADRNNQGISESISKATIKTHDGLGKAAGMRKKAFAGGWKGKAAAYGGSVLAGGLLGAGIDAAND